jgi:hypothetical protein
MIRSLSFGLISFLIAGEPALAQGQDAKADSAIVPLGVLSATLIEANTQNASVRINFFRRQSTSRIFFGFQLQGKASNGLGQLFKTGELQPGVKVGFNLGRHSIFATEASDNFDWFSIQFTHEISRMALIQPDSPFGSQLQRRTFQGASISASYNYVLAGAIVLSVSGGYAKVNNYQDLNDAEMAQETQTSDPSGKDSHVITTNRVAGKTGDYKENHSAVLQGGAFWIVPDTSSRLGVYGYQRSTLARDAQNRGTDYGASLLILKRDSPMVPLGGLIVGLLDAFNSRGSGNPLGRRMVVSITASVPVGFAKAP